MSLLQKLKSGKCGAGMREAGQSGGVSGQGPLLSVRNAGLWRSGRYILRHVDLELFAGEIVTVIGPNGAGKSSLARMALGLDAPDEGEVHRRSDLRCAWVPQKLAMDPNLPVTVRRFLSLTSRISRTEAEAALEEVGVPSLAGAEVHSLSGGEFQRVLLARAMLRKPDFLVLDEPVQGVDFAGEVALYDLIRKIRDRLGCAILLISHDLHLVMGQTDRVLCLNGHVCCQGTPQKVAESPEYQHLFGHHARSLAVYQHHHDHHHAADGRILPGPEEDAAGACEDSKPQGSRCQGGNHAG